MVKLLCAVVGVAGSAFSVLVDESDTVDDLKTAIRAKPQFGYPNSKVELFLAKKGKAWMTENDVKEVRSTSGLKHLDVARARLRCVGLSEEDMNEVDNDEEAAGNGPVNVLVVVPTAPVVMQQQSFPWHAAGINIPDQIEPLSKKAKVAHSVAAYQQLGWAWKTEVEPVYSLANDEMYFVNRDRAVLQLQEIHKANYNRALNNAGLDGVIPIADNVSGLGKSSFGNEYIRKCREAWNDVDDKSDFHKTLLACRTVRLMFVRGDLLQPSLDAVLVRRLCQQLREMFDKPPVILLNPPQDVKALLKQLTREVGPLFIVLDEIGAAFEAKNLDHLDSREQFMKFCRNFVGKWLTMRNVFFVLLGRGSFLSYVGMRHTHAQLIQIGFTLSRLSIQLLRPEAIKTIMEKTFVEYAENRTIKEVFGLDGSQLDDVVQHLFQQTCGHPRTLLMALKKCRSFSQLMEYNRSLDVENWTLFYGELRKYRKHVSTLLGTITRGEYADLTEQVEDVDTSLISLDIVAHSCCIAWEGTVDQAKLYATPFMLQLLLQYSLPFQKYLRAIASFAFSIDYPTVFEWICLKRFQEMFSSARRPTDVLPEYFSPSQAFGVCSEVSFADETRQLPKITRNGQQDPRLDSQAADPSAWPVLLEKMEADIVRDMATSVSWKPLPRSSSSDALLMTKVSDVILTLGLAAKIFTSTEFCEAHLRKECDVFNRMFQEGRNMQQKRFNVLVVCATKYNKRLSDQFDTQKSVSVPTMGYPFIHEVILLDLSTPSNRAQFFGISEDHESSEALEVIISKVEVELFEKSQK